MPTSAGPPPELAKLEEGIRASGSPLTIRDLLRLLLEALSETRGRPGLSSAPRSWFNSEEIGALESAGLGSDSPVGLTTDPVARAAAETAALWATSLRVTDAAERLGVDPSRIRQRLGERSLYGAKRGGEWHLPAFQFAEDSLVDGIDQVLRFLPEGMHPVAVWNWFRFPKPELENDAGQPLSPLDWLRGGWPAAPVAELVRDADAVI